MTPETHAYIKKWRRENPELTKEYNRNFARKYYGWKSISKVFNNILIHEIYPTFERTKKMGPKPKNI